MCYTNIYLTNHPKLNILTFPNFCYYKQCVKTTHEILCAYLNDFTRYLFAENKKLGLLRSTNHHLEQDNPTGFVDAHTLKLLT